jgi:hypothetical protein
MHTYTFPSPSSAPAGSRPVRLPFYDEADAPGNHDMLLLNARPDLLADREADAFRRLALLDLFG